MDFLEKACQIDGIYVPMFYDGDLSRRRNDRSVFPG